MNQHMADKPANLAQALNAGREVFERARSLLPCLPAAAQTVAAAATLSDAAQLVQERQQQTQHKEPKPKQKGKDQPPAEQSFPGAKVGGATSNSAYWTLVEDYFRDVTRQDVLNLLAFCIDPDEDDALLVPQLGRSADRLAAQPQPPLYRPSLVAAQGLHSHQTHNPTLSAAVDDGPDGHELKRSSRLSAKAQRRSETGWHPSSMLDGSYAGGSTHYYYGSALGNGGVRGPYCLLDHLPAADLLLMVHFAMALQQLSAADVAAAVSMEAGQLEALVQQALDAPTAGTTAAAGGMADGQQHETAYGGGASSRYGQMEYNSYYDHSYGQHYASSSYHAQSRSTSRHQRAAAAGPAAGWWGHEADVPLSQQARAALAEWLKGQAQAAGVGERRGVVAAPWAPPETDSITVGSHAVKVDQLGSSSAEQEAAPPSSQPSGGNAAVDGSAEAAVAADTGMGSTAADAQTATAAHPAPPAVHQPVAAAALVLQDGLAAGVGDASKPAALAASIAAPGVLDAAQHAAGDGNAAAHQSTLPAPVEPQHGMSAAATVGGSQFCGGQQPAQPAVTAAAELQQLQEQSGRQGVLDTSVAAGASAATSAGNAYGAAGGAEAVHDPAADGNAARLEADAAKRAARRAAEISRRRAEARLELHPYIRSLLQLPLPPHIADPGWDMQENLLGEDEPDDAAVAAGTASGSTNTNLGKGQAASGDASNVADQSAVNDSDDAAAAGTQDGFAQQQQGASQPALDAVAAGGPAVSGKRGARGGSRAKARGRGRKAGGGKTGSTAAGGVASVSTPAADAAAGGDERGVGSKPEEKGPTCVAAQAVAAIIAAAPPEGPLDAQWSQLDNAADVLALAPDDEVLAELLTLQGELLQQSAINRARSGLVLQAALHDLPNQAAASAERATWEADIQEYFTVSSVCGLNRREPCELYNPARSKVHCTWCTAQQCQNAAQHHTALIADDSSCWMHAGHAAPLTKSQCLQQDMCRHIAASQHTGCISAAGAQHCLAVVVA
eukprot:GHRR01008280.1.p1 GENE.GHRR01008280.1~~GHRR01008280.1.p1  ORF type:complete len:1011 (+),score=480.95 GHRR01008280.1:595-3627(+)